MLVTKNVLNRYNHSLLVGSLFHMETKNPFSLLKEPLMTTAIFSTKEAIEPSKYRFFVYHMEGLSIT